MIMLVVADLAGVVYSSGKVFDGLNASWHATEGSLRSGSLDGITSRSDLALLQDLRDVSQYIIDNRQTPIDHAYVRAVNAHITRSGPLHPGHYRTDAQQVGVATQYGRHEPKPVNDAGLKRIVDTAMAQPDPQERAFELFVQIAKAQPFEDGNKRTALFVANSVLIRGPEPGMLVVPTGETGAASFNELLARAYVLGEHGGIKDLLRAEGRETVVLMDAELSRRAIEALEDAEDAQEAGEILSRIESGLERTYTMAEVATELRSVTAVAAAIPEIVGRLRAVLGRDVVAALVKRTPHAVTRWMAGDAELPVREENLLRDAFQIIQLLSEVESDEVIRAWFMGMNPQLGDESPVEALSEGHARDAMAAARAFVNADG